MNMKDFSSEFTGPTSLESLAKSLSITGEGICFILDSPNPDICTQILKYLNEQDSLFRKFEYLSLPISLFGTTAQTPDDIVQQIYNTLIKSPFFNELPLNLLDDFRKAYDEGTEKVVITNGLTIENSLINSNIDKFLKQQGLEVKINMGVPMITPINLSFLVGGTASDLHENTTELRTETVITQNQTTTIEKLPKSFVAKLANLNYLISKLSGVHVLSHTTTFTKLRNTFLYDPDIHTIKEKSNIFGSSCYIQALKWLFFPVYITLIFLKWLIQPFKVLIELFVAGANFILKRSPDRLGVQRSLKPVIILDGLKGSNLLQNDEALFTIKSLLRVPGVIFLVNTNSQFLDKLIKS